MSMQAINFALTLPIEESGPRLLLLIIAHHVNYRSGDMFVGQDELAKEVKRDERTVRRYLGYLEEGGFISRRVQRSTDGKRCTDLIELIGYLEWQDVLEKGGIIQDPKTRGKLLKNQPDKMSGSAEATGQNGADQPDKNSKATGHMVSGIKGTTKDNQYNHSAPERASGVGARATAAKAVTVMTLTPADSSWGHWLSWLSDNDRRDLVVAAEEAQRMEVFGSRYPKPDSALPRIDRTNSIERRKSGEAA